MGLKILLCVLICMLLCGCTGQEAYREEVAEEGAKAVSVPAALNPGKYGTLPNIKFGWGLKKNKNAPPEVPVNTQKLLEQYGAIYIDTAPKTLYLTFDEGYENGYTAKILDVLKQYDVPAAFFITGPYLKKEEALVKRMAEEGHIVGNHTVNHPSMPEVKDIEKLKNEITELSKSFEELTGQKMQYFRPPMGEYSERTLALTQDLKMTTVFWSFAYKDWDTKAQRGTEYAYEQIMAGVHDGAILLLHAVSKDNSEVLGQVICDLKEQGYRFRSLDDFGKNVSRN